MLRILLCIKWNVDNLPNVIKFVRLGIVQKKKQIEK